MILMRKEFKRTVIVGDTVRVRVYGSDKDGYFEETVDVPITEPMTLSELEAEVTTRNGRRCISIHLLE